ncbi:hypothetical protein PINS_up024038 [Pythium insidiosum]|nr:hypothetical protein PINS_up024038 [Pythium insidiosum]
MYTFVPTVPETDRIHQPERSCVDTVVESRASEESHIRILNCQDLLLVSISSTLLRVEGGDSAASRRASPQQRLQLQRRAAAIVGRSCATCSTDTTWYPP